MVVMLPSRWHLRLWAAKAALALATSPVLVSAATPKPGFSSLNALLADGDAAVATTSAQPDRSGTMADAYLPFLPLPLDEEVVGAGVRMAPTFNTERGMGDGPKGESGAVLALAVTVNGLDRGVAEIWQDKTHLWASLQTLRGLGLAPPPDTADPLAIDAMPGATVQYRASDQSLDLVVPVTWLDADLTRANLPEAQETRATASPGAVLNHNTQANFSPGGMRIGSILDMRAFAGAGILENSQAVTLNPESGLMSVRLDTSLAFSFPDRRITVRAGDTVTSSSPWSRRTRIGGLQIGTNFALQPYLVTVPLPAFFGSAVLPSTAEIYVNGQRRFAGSVPPGPFQIGLGPTRIDGAGRAQLVLTNLLGQVTTLAMPIYETPLALRRGLTDWSLEGGVIRRRYGMSSFAYGGDPVASGTWRRGLTDNVTLILHGEGSRAVANAGAGAVGVLGSAGVVTASAAYSRSGANDGMLWGAGYSWAAGQLRLAGSIQRTTGHYADLATTIGEPALQAFDLAQVSWSSPVFGNFGANYLRQQAIGQPDSRYGGLFVSKPLGQHVSLYLSANQNFAPMGERSIFLTLSLAGRRRQASLNASFQNGGTALDATLQQAPALSGGLGWKAGLRRDTAGTSGAAEIDWLNGVGEARAGLATSSGRVSGYVAYSGAVALMEGGLFPGRWINTSFAVVSTGNLPHVPVLFENRIVGRTDAHGRLLVTDLNAYQHNHLSIDVTDLPAGYEVEKVDLDVTPVDRAGVFVRFPLHPFSAVQMTLVDAAGTTLPAGTPVASESAAPDTVGFDGQLYIERPTAGDRMVAQGARGPCHFILPPRIIQGDIMRLGKVTCEVGP